MSDNMTIIYLCLGSNIGDRQANLKIALDNLSHRLRLGKVSSIYDTAPVGNVNQPRFLNMVCEAYTMLAPLDLLALTQGIEIRQGRPPGTSGAPRIVDVDILLYGSQVVELPQLRVPHPRMHERAFVLVPLAEIAPAAKHPTTRKTIKQLLKLLPSQDVVMFEEAKKSDV